MISLLISLLVLLVLIYVSYLIVDAIALPENIKKIVMIILGLIFLLLLLSQLGFVNYGPYLR